MTRPFLVALALSLPMQRLPETGAVHPPNPSPLHFQDSRWHESIIACRELEHILRGHGNIVELLVPELVQGDGVCFFTCLLRLIHDTAEVSNLLARSAFVCSLESVLQDGQPSKLSNGDDSRVRRFGLPCQLSCDDRCTHVVLI